MGVEFLGLFSMNLIFFPPHPHPHMPNPTVSVCFCLVCLVFSGWVINVNFFFFPGGGGGGGGGVCVCAFFLSFLSCYTAPKNSYILYKDNKIYLKCPVPQSVYLSLCVSLSVWLVCWCG